VSTSELANSLVLGALLDDLEARHGGFDLLAHWTQGEFHHDLIVRVNERWDLPGDFLIVATNCNGGVKEVLCVSEMPNRGGLWRMRCPDNPEFEGDLPKVLDRSTTIHFFEPGELLSEDARSELREEHRQRQSGGGWVCKKS
jgi:hypothetical protein